jgi:hypothetical protein
MRPDLFFWIVIGIVTFVLQEASAQNTRLRDDNAIGWYTYTATFRMHQQWSLHTEYQWRREDFGPTWQQSLLRVGLNHHLNPSVMLHLGYGWIETFNYGDYPINGFGKQFPEHRIYQQVNVSQKIGRVDLLHRYRLEQRWLGRFDRAESSRPNGWNYLNRLRYMLRLQVPLRGSTLDNKEFYIAAFDEIFIGFGKKVNQNVFDQNRVSFLAGYRVNQNLRIEAGYLQQITQLPRRIDDRNVFQYNSGLLLNLVINANLKKDL